MMQMVRRLRRERSSDAISDVQYSVLALIDRRGPQTIGALAEFENVQAPSMTRTVGCLVEAGLVRRTKHPDDGRCVLIELTDTGRDEIHTTRARRTAWLAGELATLTPAQQTTLSEAADLLRELVRR